MHTMKWIVTVAVGPIAESAVGALISTLPPVTIPVLVGYEEMRLALVNVRTEASSDDEAAALGLGIFNKAASTAGLSLQPEVRRVEATGEA
jgi:hypothetical protein